MDSVTVDGQQLAVVTSFCYLGDSISAGGGCEAATVTEGGGGGMGMGKFQELLLILGSKSLSSHTRGRVYSSCVRGVMLYACECWALKRMDLDRLHRNKRAVIRWMCAIKSTDNISTQELRLRLCIDDLDVALRRMHLRWFDHVLRSESWTGKVCSLHVDGRRIRGRPQKKLVGGPKRGTPVICTNPRGHKQQLQSEGACATSPSLLHVKTLRKRKKEALFHWMGTVPSFFVNCCREFLFGQKMELTF